MEKKKKSIFILILEGQKDWKPTQKLEPDI